MSHPDKMFDTIHYGNYRFPHAPLPYPSGDHPLPDLPHSNLAIPPDRVLATVNVQLGTVDWGRWSAF